MNVGDIEPIAGAGFAMCLAYLALDRFRYRAEIEATAKKALATLDREGDGQPDPPPSIANNDAMLELKWHARLQCNGFHPSHPLSWFYSFFYRREFDVRVTAALAALSALTLVAGVANKISAMPFLDWMSYPWGVTLAFYMCLTCIMAPPFFVWLGRRIMAWSQGRAAHLEKQLMDLLTDRAATAQAPPLPENEPNPTVS